MRPVSERFLAAARSSHTMVSRVTLVDDGQWGVTPSGRVLPVVSGDVALTAKSGVRSTLDMATPLSWGGIAPYGDEVFVERGIDYGDGTREWVGLGYFRLYGVEQSDAPFGTLRLSGKDRMSAIVDGRLEGPVTFAGTVTTGSVVTQLVGDVLPGVPVEWDDQFDQRLRVRHITDEKRFEFLDEMITATGRVWYFDHRGVLVIRFPPSITVPVWEVNAGPGGLLISSSRELSRDGVYNAVVASGEASDGVPQARAVVRDVGSNSVTRWGGRFGKVPRFYSSSFITHNGQARQAAASILAKAIGLPYAADFDAVVNPALEPYDPVRLLAGVGEQPRTFLVDALKVPLTADGSMSGSMRDQSDVTIAGD